MMKLMMITMMITLISKGCIMSQRLGTWNHIAFMIHIDQTATSTVSCNGFKTRALSINVVKMHGICFQSGEGFWIKSIFWVISWFIQEYIQEKMHYPEAQKFPVNLTIQEHPNFPLYGGGKKYLYKFYCYLWWLKNIKYWNVSRPECMRR